MPSTNVATDGASGRICPRARRLADALVSQTKLGAGSCAHLLFLAASASLVKLIARDRRRGARFCAAPEASLARAGRRPIAAGGLNGEAGVEADFFADDVSLKAHVSAREIKRRQAIPSD